MNEIVKNYGKLNKRNNKKDNLHLNKHALHLIRLFLMCIDIFEKEDIITYRENDLKLLMSIRNGEFQKDDGNFRSEFWEMVDFYDTKMRTAAKDTSLPDHPNIAKVEEFVMSINERVVKNEFMYTNGC